MRFPAKITSSCIWVAIPVDWNILHWYLCGAYGRADTRTGVRSRDYQNFSEGEEIFNFPAWLLFRANSVKIGKAGILKSRHLLGGTYPNRLFLGATLVLSVSERFRTILRRSFSFVCWFCLSVFFYQLKFSVSIDPIYSSLWLILALFRALWWF